MLGLLHFSRSVFLFLTFLLLTSSDTVLLLFQCEKWTDNPDQFVEEEDEDSFTYSVRISSQDLLLVSCSFRGNLKRKQN